MRRAWPAILVQTMMFLGVAAVVWWPEYSHYRIPEHALPTSQMEALEKQPSDQVLDRVARIDIMNIAIQSATDQAIALRLLENRIDVVGLTRGEARLQGWPQDLEAPSAVDGLVLVSLELEDRALRQYEISGDPALREWAQLRMMDFIRYESKLNGPVGYVWNDHAIAARISVLTRFWRILRSDTSVSGEIKAEVLRSVNRHGEFLAKKSHFTVQTNHGVMQNIGLLQIAVAFPYLPSAKAWEALAMERLRLQLGFYVSSEGIILEHSPGYHLFGTVLLQHILELYSLLNTNPPKALISQYEGALRYLRQIVRSDCSFPRVGNTIGGVQNFTLMKDFPCKGKLSKQEVSVPRYWHIYPVSGYALWGTNDTISDQTFVAWSHFLNHPHKHADEPSVVYWRDGVEWITAVGYWPYESDDYWVANGWQGSNAPHELNEVASSARSSRLRATASAKGITLVDVETVRNSGMSARRQVIQVGPDVLLVLDHVASNSKAVETIWTVDESVTLNEVGNGKYQATHAASGKRMDVVLANLLGSPWKGEVVKGRRDPFAGWTVVDHIPVPTYSLRQERRDPQSATAQMFKFGHASISEAVQINVLTYSNPELWHLRIAAGEQIVDLQRTDEEILLATPDGPIRVPLIAYSPEAQAAPATVTAIHDAMSQYPRWRDYRFYRLRMLLALTLLWGFAVAATVFVERYAMRRAYLSSVAVVMWTAIGLWLKLVYFQ